MKENTSLDEFLNTPSVIEVKNENAPSKIQYLFSKRHITYMGTNMWVYPKSIYALASVDFVNGDINGSKKFISNTSIEDAYQKMITFINTLDD